MDDEREKIIKARFEELPEDIQHAIQSNDVDRKVQEVGRKHQLHIDQIQILDDETRLVMLGFTDPSDFIDQIGLQLHIAPPEAESIAEEISNTLFIRIRESMQQYMENRALQAQLAKEEKIKAPISLSQPPTLETGPIQTPITPSSIATPIAPPILPSPPINHADIVLSQPTVSIAPNVTPPAPTIPLPTSEKVQNPTTTYKTDPYREPTE